MVANEATVGAGAVVGPGAQVQSGARVEPGCEVPAGGVVQGWAGTVEDGLQEGRKRSEKQGWKINAGNKCNTQ